jgi:hypothetical protein
LRKRVAMVKTITIRATVSQDVTIAALGAGPRRMTPSRENRWSSAVPAIHMTVKPRPTARPTIGQGSRVARL